MKILSWFVGGFFLALALVNIIVFSDIVSGIFLLIVGCLFLPFVVSILKGKAKVFSSLFARGVLIIALLCFGVYMAKPATKSGYIVFSIRVLNRVILEPFRAKKDYQAIFEKLHAIGVHGMNYGRVNDMDADGETFTLNYVQQKLTNKNNAVIFDVGANIGNYSVEILKAFDSSKVKIYAIEPSATSFGLLGKKFTNKQYISLHKIGLGAVNDTLKLYSSQYADVTASLIESKRYGEQDRVEKVVIKTLDGFCKEQGVKFIDFLKLDVEGYEYPIFKGGTKMLSEGKIKYIQFEFGAGLSNTFKDFYDLLKNNYHIYRITMDGFYEIKEYDPMYQEIYSPSNFFAVLKNK